MKKYILDNTNQNEFERIKDILFPRKKTVSTSVLQVSNSVMQFEDNPIIPMHQQHRGQSIRDEIQKLRTKFNSMVGQKRFFQQNSGETQRIYLNGISKISKNFKNTAAEIQEVFDDFIEHMPIKKEDGKQQNNHYYLSLLKSQVSCKILLKILQKSLKSGFKQIVQKSQFKLQRMKKLSQIIKKKQQKQDFQTYQQLDRCFNSWRYNNLCEAMQSKASLYYQNNNLQYQRKINQNINNLPLLTLSLEEFYRGSSDICQILILDKKQEKMCKYKESEQLRSDDNSLETVTYRSVLQSQRKNIKIKRLQIQLCQSLTKNCITRGESLLISKFKKHQEYSQIDDHCFASDLPLNLCKNQKFTNEKNKQAVALYPLISSNSQCIAVMRQYFNQGNLKALTAQNISKMCSTLQLSLVLDSQSKTIAELKHYQSKNYYLSMVKMIQCLQNRFENQDHIFKTLSSTFEKQLNIKKTSIFMVLHNQGHLMLKSIWGSSQPNKNLLSILNQIKKQQKPYIYLQDRIVVSANMMLFEFFLHQQDSLSSRQSENHTKRLPIQLINKTVFKVQSILRIKKQQQEQLVQNKKQIQKISKINKFNQFRNQFQKQCIESIGNVSINQSLYQNLTNLWTKYQIQLKKASLKTENDFKQIKAFMVVNSNAKNEVLKVNLQNDHLQPSQPNHQQKEDKKRRFQIKINQFVKLIIEIVDFNDQMPLEKQLFYVFQQIVRTYISQKNQKIQQLDKQKQKQEINFQSLTSYQITPNLQRKSTLQLELYIVKLIYFKFTKIIERFNQKYFSCSSRIDWQRQQPNEKNIQQWKKMIYQFSLIQSSQIQIDIVQKVSMMDFQEYQQLRAITQNKLQNILQQSWLIIKPKDIIFQFKLKNSFVMIKLPFFFNFLKQSQFSQKIKGQLNKIKEIWIKYCHQLIDSKLKHNQNLRLTAVANLFNNLNLNYQNRLKNSLKSIQRANQSDQKIQNQTQKMLKALQKYEKKLIFSAFQRLKQNQMQLRQVKKRKYILACLQSKFFNIFTRKCFQYSFQRIKTRQTSTKLLQRAMDIFQLYNHKNCLDFQQNFVCRLVYHSGKRNQCRLLSNICNSIFLSKINQVFFKIKVYSQPKQKVQQMNQTFSSFESLSLYVSTVLPQYSIYFLQNSQPSYCLYSPKKLQFKPSTLQQLISAYPQSTTYQTGSAGQLLWLYQLQNKNECFTVKDILNRVSKTIQDGLKNIKQNFQLKLINLLIFRNDHIRNMTTLYWKKWRKQAYQQLLVEKNRMNDNVYQLSIETQAMRQKNKFLQKILNSNNRQYEQLQLKKQQYQTTIKFCSQKIIQIEESGNKLQNVNNVYQALHRRTLIKTTMLLWRKYALEIKLIQQKNKKRQCFQRQKRVAIKSCSSILSQKLRQIYIESFIKLKKHCKIHSKKLQQLQKLQVLFEENINSNRIVTNLDSNRLVTFSSVQKENSNHHNSSSPQAKTKYFVNVPDKMKLNALNYEGVLDVSADQMSRYGNGAYKLNPKTLKFLKRMGKLEKQ